MIYPLTTIDLLTPGVRKLFDENNSYIKTLNILKRSTQWNKVILRKILDKIIINEFKERIKLQTKLNKFNAKL